MALVWCRLRAMFQGQPSFSSSVARAGAAAKVSLWCLHCFRHGHTTLFGSYPARSSGSVVWHVLILVELWPKPLPWECAAVYKQRDQATLGGRFSGLKTWARFLTCPSSLRPQLKSQGLNHMLKCFARIDFSICLTWSQVSSLKSMGLKHILKC